MGFTIEDIKEAYNRFRTYVYYDNSEILLRRQLVEFETNTTKSSYSIFKQNPDPYPKNNGEDIFNMIEYPQIVNLKLEYITDQLNSYHETPEFFKQLIDKIDVHFYPKKYEDKGHEDNFISNVRQKESYTLDRITAFINAPIEIHLLSVLWIMQKGVKLDAELSSNCYGNRLLLNNDKTKLIQGSSLFKPYFKQYQKWRDKSVETAQNLLNDGKDVLFLNLDVKDYFHSVRIENSVLFSGREGKRALLQPNCNLDEILLKTHHNYTEIVSKKYQIPNEFYSDLSKDQNGVLQNFILPIGLLSSYVLANSYLKDFDKRMIEKYNPAYYGRYVDDILLVVGNPNLNDDEGNSDFKFNFEDYKIFVKEKLGSDLISFSENELTKSERFVLSNFSPQFLLLDSSNKLNDINKKSVNRVFKIHGYKSLYCQTEKTLLHYFDANESDLIIDKLKQELYERSSEFRDLPTNEESIGDFEKNAYHLHYTGHEGKIRTLKDYQENRYGLTVYLASQIYSALRHDKKITPKEIKQVLNFFKGENCLTFYRLWERIFTFFLVNDESKAYVEFYFHCITHIDRIKNDENDKLYIGSTLVEYYKVRDTLMQYLDCANELTLSLNPEFISKTKEVAMNFEFKTNEVSLSSETIFLGHHQITGNNSYWFRRFRETNMIRQQYVVFPLLSFTTESKNGNVNLTSSSFNISNYNLDEQLITNSPRPIKFWECTLSLVYEKLSGFSRNESVFENEYFKTNILGSRNNEAGDEFYLDEAFERYKKINENHYPEYSLKDDNFRNQFYEIETQEITKSDNCNLYEYKINSSLSNKISNPKIAFANTIVEDSNINASIINKTNLSIERYQKFASILNESRKEKSDIVLFPECYIPINLLSSLVRFSEKNEMMIVTGLEHVISDKTAFNFVVTSLPIKVNGITDSVVVIRLKNNYAHFEEHLIKGNHLSIPKPMHYRYDIFNWKNIYSSLFYCFELANVQHRSLLKGKVDLLIATEWNKDTPYFSNIVESCSRDIHCFFAQVNTSQYGDTRLTQPSESARKDLLRLKGGINDSILIGQIDIDKLRDFQRKKYLLTHNDDSYKPLPPDYPVDMVIKRIENDFTS